MTALPRGTVTFLFTDIEGSTMRWEQHPDAMRAALARHDAVLHEGITAHGGVVITERGEGDSFFALFARPSDALEATCAIQRALVAEPWAEEVVPLRVRMALHTGEAGLWEGRDYRGAAVNRCARLRAVAHGGQVLLSRATYEMVRDHLPSDVTLRDLGEHRLRDLTGPEHIFQVVVPALPADFPPLKTLDAHRHNLPVQLTSFVGRVTEMAEVTSLLEETRLLTLTGPGGTGKTRLALQVAARHLEQYRDGVWLMELAPLADPALIPQTIATVLDVREEAGRALLTTLAEALRHRTLLLVLDNCEHLIDACARLADMLLHACPHVQLLATSREALGIAGETTWRVPSLALPDPAHLPSLDTLAQTEAVRLFVERARAVQPHFVVTEQNAATVVQVCQRLDGIPLALELAAARLRSLSVEHLATRLDQRFRLLTGGSRTALPRQQTLQATVEWSYSLLSPDEQVLFDRLSVFAGGFTLEAAEAVCGDDTLGATEVLDVLLRLVDKSLVLAEDRADGESGYRLLETLRQYGREHLAGRSDGPAVYARHAAYCLRLAEMVAPQLRASTQASWLARLDALRADVGAAWHWYLDGGRTAEAVRLWQALIWYWYFRSFAEGQAWLHELLALPTLMGPARARVLAEAGAWAFTLGAITEARQLLEEGLALSRQWRDVGAEAFALWHLGGQRLALDVEGGAAQGRSMLEQALTLQRTLDDQWQLGLVLADLILATCLQGDLAAATRHTHELRALARDLRNRQLQAYGLEALGLVAATAEDASEAMRRWEEALAVFREVGDDLEIAIVEGRLGRLTVQQGRYTEGRQHLVASLRLLQQRGAAGFALWPLKGLASCAGAAGDAARGLRLAAASLAFYDAHGYQMLAEHREELERVIMTARSELREQVAAAAWAEGQVMTLEQAVAYALEE